MKQRGTYIRTPETLAKIGAASRRNWENPEFRAKIAATIKRRWERRLLHPRSATPKQLSEKNYRAKVRRILGPLAVIPA